MSRLQIVPDIAMYALWILTYILVLIGTIKYRYPLISPITQAIIAPFEWSVLFEQFNRLGEISFDYVFIAYLFWAILEIAIFRAIEKMGYVKKIYVKPYIVMVILITIVKFIADVLGAIVYYGKGSWLINVLSILLPILEFFLIPVWFVRRKIAKRADSSKWRDTHEPKE